MLGSWNVIQDTKWVRYLEVAPETFAYLWTPAPFPSHYKQLCGNRSFGGNVHSASRFPTTPLDLSLLEIETLIAEAQANDKQLAAGRAEQAQTISHLSKSLMQSKEIMEKQKQLYELLYTFELGRTSSLRNSPVFIMSPKVPSRKPKKHPLPTGARQHLARILAGHERMGDMDNSLIDCLHRVRELEGCVLSWNRCKDDVPDPITWNRNRSVTPTPTGTMPTHPKYWYIAPSGEMHDCYAAHPTLDTRCYTCQPGQPRLCRPYTFDVKKRNDVKRTCYATLIKQVQDRHKHNGNQQAGLHRNQANNSPPPADCQTRLLRLRNHISRLQAMCHGAQRREETLRRHLSACEDIPGPEQLKKALQHKLSTHISDNVWKTKELVRLKCQLLKMERQRGYTRIERALSARTTEPPYVDSAANISSVTATSEPGTDPVNWEHEARRLIATMRTMESNRVASDKLIDNFQQQIRDLQ